MDLSSYDFCSLDQVKQPLQGYWLLGLKYLLKFCDVFLGQQIADTDLQEVQRKKSYEMYRQVCTGVHVGLTVQANKKNTTMGCIRGN